MGRITAAFALGEMDGGGAEAAPALIPLLDDDSHRIVRTALDTLGMVGGTASDGVERIARFLVEGRSDWEDNLTGKRAWCGRDRVRINATIALARLGTRPCERRTPSSTPSTTRLVTSPCTPPKCSAR